MVIRCLVQYAGINAWIMFKKCTGSQISRKSFIFLLQLIEEFISCGQGLSSSNRLLPTQPFNILAEPQIKLKKRKHQRLCQNITPTVCRLAMPSLLRSVKNATVFHYDHLNTFENNPTGSFQDKVKNFYLKITFQFFHKSNVLYK